MAMGLLIIKRAILITAAVILAAFLTGCARTVVKPRPTKELLSRRVQALFPKCEIVKQVLIADVNGDGRSEVVVASEDSCRDKFLPSAKLYIMAERDNKLKIARELSWNTLMLDSSRKLRVEDVNGDRRPEVLLQVCGADHIRLVVMAFQERHYALRVLYEQPVQGSADVLPQHEDHLPRIIEHWCVWHLFGCQSPPGFQGHVLARRIYEWNSEKQRYLLRKTEPDIEEERKLTPEELLNIPGAKVLLKGVHLRKR